MKVSIGHSTEIDKIRNKNTDDYEIVKEVKSIDAANINLMYLFEDVLQNSIKCHSTDIDKIIYEHNNGMNDFKRHNNYQKLLEAIINVSLLRFIEILEMKLKEIDTGVIEIYDSKDLVDGNTKSSKNLHEAPNEDYIKTHKSDENADEYLRSIKEISMFLGCGITKAQSIKNKHPSIFLQMGKKFMVKKEDLLFSLKNNKNKRN